MIRVTVELIPGGIGAPVLLGEAIIANDCTGTLDTGNYDVRLMKSPRYAKSPGVWKRGHVEGFARRSKRVGPWDLLYRALAATVGDRNPEVRP